MIQFARLVDADARPIRTWHDEEVETLQVSGAERIAAAKFDIEAGATTRTPPSRSASPTAR